MARLVNVPLGESKKPSETAERVNSHVYYDHNKEVLVRPSNMKCNTVYEYIIECLEKSKNKDVLAYRNLVNVHDEEKILTKKVNGKEVETKKTWQFYELGDYKYEKGQQLLDTFTNYGKGLIKLGLKPHSEDKVHIFASTSDKWMKTFLAAQSQALTVATAYDTLGESGLIHSIKQTSSKLIFTDNALLAKLLVPVQKCESIKFIVYSEKIDPNDKRQNGKIYKAAHDAVEKIKEARPDIKIISMQEVIALGLAAKDELEVHPPTPEDISCIMYTSGSTGEPKGVVLSHKNIVGGLGGISSVIDKSIVNEKDRIIAFLPLAHIFELAFELITFYWGGILGYAGVKTLSDTSVRNCEGDMKAFKPSIMVGVPAVWEQVRKGILGQISKQPAMTQKIFWAAYHTKIKCDKYKIPILPNIISNVIFKKVKQATGGNIRLMLNGGSPLSHDAQEFISTLIGPMLIGYGLTETVANTAILSPNNFEFDVCGQLTGAIKVKLVDAEELGYFAKNDQGEVWINGNPVLEEYYKNDKETKDALFVDPETNEKWFMTGDIGCWTPTGQLKIIDRKKNLVKTMNGEYIALEKLESVYRSNAYLDNICVYADQSKVKPIGIAVPNHKKCAEKAIELGLIEHEDELHNVLNDPKLTDAVLQELLKTGKSQGLAGIELILNVVLFDGEWTPDSGFVTSAQKLQRKKILAAVQKEVDAAYQ
ncbi:hypothetical protein FOG48_02938 [Hanseniaspora uvarum]|nr:hypothetical protein FOG48_02938 [Hanseniaspora uvarum]